MKKIYISLFSTAFLFTASASLARDDQQAQIETILQVLAAQEETIEKLKNTLLPNIQPVGSLIFMASEKPPAGYLYCDGSALSRTEYGELFDSIGTTWGQGNGSTTFNLPDLRGEFIRIWSKGHTVDAGRRVGQAQNQSTAMPAATFAVLASGQHTHSVPAGGNMTLSTGNNTRLHSHTRMNSNATAPGSYSPAIADGRKVAVNGTPNLFTVADGQHDHSIAIPAHNHPSVAGNSNHTHTITGGDPETRSRNQALACYIKVFSHSTF